MSSSASNASAIASGVTAVPHSTANSLVSIPWVLAIFMKRSPNFPPTTFNIFSPGATVLAIPASIAAVPDPVNK